MPDDDSSAYESEEYINQHVMGSVLKVVGATRNKPKDIDQDKDLEELAKGVPTEDELKYMSEKRMDELLNAHDKSVGLTPSTRRKPKIIERKWFNFLVYTAICTNSVQMGLAIDFQELDDVWQICEHVYTSAFLLEMLVKMIVLRKRYFDDSWNRMDCFLVCMSVLDNWIIAAITQGDGTQMSQISVLRVLRVCRVARIARLFKVFKELWVILKGILDSLRVIFWVIVLLVLTLYVCSILCVDMMGRQDLYPGYDADEESIEAGKAVAMWNNYVYFGTISRSMYTLFNVVILAEFSEFGRAMIEKQPEMAIFFVFFIVFTTFGILNVIIGVIVDNTMEAAKSMDEENDNRQKREKLRLLERIRDIVFALDVNADGRISVHEIVEGWERPQLKQVLKEMKLPAGFTPTEFMFLLDRDGRTQISYDEFITNFYRVLLNDSFQMNCSLHASLNELKTEVKLLRRRDAEMITKEEVLEQVAQMKEETTQEIHREMEGIKEIMLSVKSSLEKSGVGISGANMSIPSMTSQTVTEMRVEQTVTEMKRAEEFTSPGKPNNPVVQIADRDGKTKFSELEKPVKWSSSSVPLQPDIDKTFLSDPGYMKSQF